MKNIDAPVPPLRVLDFTHTTNEGNEYFILSDSSGYSDKRVAISKEALPVLLFFDGTKTLSDVVNELSAASGENVDKSELGALVEFLDECFFLQNERFEARRRKLEKEYAEEALREDILSGVSYPCDKKELAAFLDNHLNTPFSDDIEPELPDLEKRINGIIVPHIDFERGGSAYGRCYKLLHNSLERHDYNDLLVIILGVCHKGSVSPVVATRKNFYTPFGITETDQDAVAILNEIIGPDIFSEEWNHKNEHSIELQMVWLKYILKDIKWKSLPLLVSHFDADHCKAPNQVDRKYNDIDSALHYVINSHNGPVLIVSSIDLSHVGKFFGDDWTIDPYKRALVERYDMSILENIKNSDAESWWLKISSSDNIHRICGYYTNYLFLNLLKGNKGYIIDYQQAVSLDKEQMVTFTSAVLQ